MSFSEMRQHYKEVGFAVESKMAPEVNIYNKILFRSQRFFWLEISLVTYLKVRVCRRLKLLLINFNGEKISDADETCISKMKKKSISTQRLKIKTSIICIRLPSFIKILNGSFISIAYQSCTMQYLSEKNSA